MKNITNKYISRCTYSEDIGMNLKKINTFLFTINKFIVLDPYCPVFLVNYVLTKAEPDREDRYKMLINVSLFKQNFTRKPFF